MKLLKVAISNVLAFGMIVSPAVSMGQAPTLQAQQQALETEIEKANQVILNRALEIETLQMILNHTSNSITSPARLAAAGGVSAAVGATLLAGVASMGHVSPNDPLNFKLNAVANEAISILDPVITRYDYYGDAYTLKEGAVAREEATQKLAALSNKLSKQEIAVLAGRLSTSTSALGNINMMEKLRHGLAEFPDSALGQKLQKLEARNKAIKKTAISAIVLGVTTGVIALAKSMSRDADESAMDPQSRVKANEVIKYMSTLPQAKFEAKRSELEMAYVKLAAIQYKETQGVQLMTSQLARSYKAN